MKKTLLLILTLLTQVHLIHADEDVSFKAEAPNVVREGQQFRLTYTVNTDVDKFDPPEITDFSVLAGPSTSTSTNVSIVNGKMTKNYTLQYTYVLQANKKGKFTIPYAKIKVGQKVYRSNELQIEVIESKSRSSSGGSAGQAQQDQQTTETGDPGNKLFVRVLLNKRNVYREEPIIATIKIYSKMSISNLQNVKFPDFKGFFKQEIETPSLRQLQKENINGEIYGTGVLKKYILFPQKTGEITIDPFEVDCIVQKRVNSQSRSFFDDFFGGYQNVKMPLASKPVTVDVKPLPTGQPANFTGGVGNFKLEASLDKSEVKTNEAVNLTVKVSGSGNLKVVDVPKIDFPPDLETYDPKINSDINVSERGAVGFKEYEYPVVPRHAGEYRIPSIQFTYFDLSAGKYKTLNSGPLTLQVAKGEADTSVAVSRSYNRKDVSVIGSDIRYIKTEDFSIEEKGSFVFGSLEFYLVYIAGIMVFVVVFLFQRKRAKENANVALAKNRKANKFAKKRLKVASRHLGEGNKENFYEETLKALWGYLSDKLGIPVSELSRDNAREQLEKMNIEGELTDKFINLIDDCEYARYAPASDESRMDELYREAIGVISKLQQKLK